MAASVGARAITFTDAVQGALGVHPPEIRRLLSPAARAPSEILDVDLSDEEGRPNTGGGTVGVAGAVPCVRCLLHDEKTVPDPAGHGMDHDRARFGVKELRFNEIRAVLDAVC
jgi:hypothetical protein